MDKALFAKPTSKIDKALMKVTPMDKQDANNKSAAGSYYTKTVYETINYMEYIATELTKNKVDPKQILCICQALKYLSPRLGSKDETPIELDLEKAENYIHRARTGKWMDKESLTK